MSRQQPKPKPGEPIRPWPPTGPHAGTRYTAAQRLWLDRLAAAGADAGVWRPVDWPGRITAELRAAARGSVGLLGRG